MLCSEPLWAPLWSWSENNWCTIMRKSTKNHLYYQGSSTEGSARSTVADEAHLFQKDQATHKVNIVNLACQGYSFSSVWTPPTIFKTRLALPHLGRKTGHDPQHRLCQRSPNVKQATPLCWQLTCSLQEGQWEHLWAGLLLRGRSLHSRHSSHWCGFQNLFISRLSQKKR